MGLDVLVLKCVVPPRDVLDGGSKARAKWCKENRCEIKILDDDIDERKIEKLSRTLFLFEYDEKNIIDWEATFNAKGLNYEDYDWLYDDGRSYGFFLAEDETQCVSFDYGEIRTCKKRVKAICILDKHFGYQRKGANDQFYKDGKWDSDTIVTTRKELLDDWRRYFGRKKEFHENIVKNFREGEHIVAYW